MSRQIALTLVLLSLTPAAHAQDPDPVVCHCHVADEHDHGNCDNVKMLQHRVDHQIQEADDLIERLNRYADQREATAQPVPLVHVDAAFTGPPFLGPEHDTAAEEAPLEEIEMLDFEAEEAIDIDIDVEAEEEEEEDGA
jgi:hypothetical protein